MSTNRQIQISAALLEELLVSADGVAGIVGQFVQKSDNAEARAALARLGRASSSAAVLLRAAAGPGSFSGDEVGQYRIDPSQSQFL